MSFTSLTLVSSLCSLSYAFVPEKRTRSGDTKNSEKLSSQTQLVLMKLFRKREFLDQIRSKTLCRHQSANQLCSKSNQSKNTYMYVWGGERCEEWPENNAQCQAIEFCAIEFFFLTEIHLFPTNLNPSSTSNFLMCTLLKHGSGVVIMLVGNMLHKRLPFCCNQLLESLLGRCYTPI